ncbi:MAG TPA: M1 family metallopeptidase [Vicinamibacterales bacterium]|nr:M1 family metallopeptidase [Vicinamibacterales bacterium]
MRSGPRAWSVPVLASMLAACGGTSPAPTDTGAPETTRDMHSYARPDEARVTHVALDLRADFERRTLTGTATLTIRRADGAREIVLDTKDLTIETVTDAAGNALIYSMGAADPILGVPLTIALPSSGSEVVIRYRTSPSAAALQWLAPSQTAGGRHPFLYSQGQAILTRTWIPTQDSPGIRQTYSARITVPGALRAVMSAAHLTPEGREAGSERTFEFRLEQPVPAYLIALAVGDIAFRSVGPRTGVFTEPSVLERAAHEFADMEKMVEAAERLYGPYRWGRFDVLVLPPSFPFGGMENPRLTFLTPTVLAGDRSLTSVIAHELAHSWSGNLVTNATWRDFWLNEGFTTYFENRIMEALYGPERAAMLRAIGRRELLDELERLADRPNDTILYIDLAGRDPDDGATQVPYEKGAAFLRLIEEVVGRERFDAYLRSYFDEYAFQSMTTHRFLDDLRSRLFKGDAALERRTGVEEWVFKPGLPANAPAVTSEAFERVEQAARAFVEGTPPDSLPTRSWSTQEWQHFLTSLPEKLSPTQLAALDKAFGFAARNSEIRFLWLRIAIRHHYEPALPALEEFLTSQGRRKFVRPLFEDLLKTEWGRPVAERIFAKARPMYHSVTAGSVEELFQRK